MQHSGLTSDAIDRPQVDASAVRNSSGEVRASLARLAGAQRGIHAMVLVLEELGTLNVAFGRTLGDRVLMETERRIRQFIRDEISVGSICTRLDGNSFLLASSQECTRARWECLGEALADAVAVPFCDKIEAMLIRLRPRIILARAGSGDDPLLVLDKLAEGLGRIRDHKVRRIIWADGKENCFGAGRRKLEHEFLKAIDRQQIAIVFQPQYTFADDCIYGAEALARWDHPRLGRLGAATLFALAARTGQVSQLSRHIIEHALRKAAAWPGTLQLSVNATPTDLSAASFADELLAMLHGAGFAPSRLTMEITEDTLIGDLAIARQILSTLSAEGVQIALDDFGAGFCNFQYLKTLPLHHLKLDRSMVENIADTEPDRAVFRGIVAMAHALSLKVIVEGVETDAQRLFAAEQQCHIYQGFLRSCAVDNEEIVRMLRA